MNLRLLPLGFVLILALSGCETTPPTFETVELTPLNNRQYTTYVGDLNGDGSEETLSFTKTDNKETGYATYVLAIDEVSIGGAEENLAGYFGVVDIDTRDPYKEIVVGNFGPSSDYSTDFYYYDGSQLISMGTISGLYEDMEFDSAGSLVTETRGLQLDTWFYADTHTLSESHQLMQVPLALYPRYTEVTVLKALELSPNPLDGSFVDLSLIPGDKATIVGCDNLTGCLVMDAKGQEGWLALEEFNKIKGTEWYSSDVFDGLSFAD